MSSPGTAYVVPARAGVWLVWCTSWGRPACRACRVAGQPSSLLVGVFVGVRLRTRGIPGNALLSKIYILARSEPPLQRVSSEKSAQLARSEHPRPSYVSPSHRASCTIRVVKYWGGREPGAAHPATNPGAPPGGGPHPGEAPHPGSAHAGRMVHYLRANGEGVFPPTCENSS